jgi:hypothetical protein
MTKIIKLRKLSIGENEIEYTTKRPIHGTVTLKYIYTVYAESSSISVTEVALHLENVRSLLSLKYESGVKVTCRLNDTVYLGRANRILTRSGMRFCTWISSINATDNESSDEGVMMGGYEQQTEETCDLEEIRAIQSPRPVSALPPRMSQKRTLSRRDSFRRPKYTPDNDDFRNPIYRLPFNFTKDLIIEVYNFGCLPVHCIKFSIARAKFDVPRRKSPLKLSTKKKKVKTHILDTQYPFDADRNVFIKVTFTTKDDTVTVTRLEIKIALDALMTKQE